jgi:hypothetical protein
MFQKEVLPGGASATGKTKKGDNAKDHPSTPNIALNELLLRRFIANTEKGTRKKFATSPDRFVSAGEVAYLSGTTKGRIKR